MLSKKIIFIIVFGTVFGVTVCQRKKTESKKVTESSMEIDTIVSNTYRGMNITVSDSLALTELIKNLLKWHEDDIPLDFMPLTKFQNDSVYSGINWEIHNKRMKQLSETEFFSEGFLENYQNIAVHLDKELKENSERYYVGYLPPYGNGANEWCNCQDFPPDWENNLIIIDLKIDANFASFKWTWFKEYYYFIRTQKNENLWQIDYMERFDIKYFTW